MPKTHYRRVRSRPPAILSHKANAVCLHLFLTAATWAVAPPRRPPIATSRHPSGITSFIADLNHYPSCPQRSMWIFLYFLAPHVPLLASVVFVMSLCLIKTSPTSLILIKLQFVCHRDAQLDFSETAQNDPMVKGLQTSFLQKVQPHQQIQAWLGFRVQGLGTAWIVLFFSCLCSKISVNFVLKLAKLA